MTNNIISVGKLHIAITSTNQYVVLVDGKVVAGPFQSAAEAIRAREKIERERRRA